MPTLSLLRHTKAAQPLPHQSDFDRPLTERGRTDAARVGARLAGLQIELVLVSTARRTRETWEIARTSLNPQPESEVEAGLYLCSPRSLVARLQEIPDRFGHILLIGHNPGLHEVALWLASGSVPSLAKSELQRKFPTAALAVFDFADTPWSALAPDAARLTLFATPSVTIAGA